MLPAEIICTSAHPTATVIWLHGLGADGHDFAPVAERLGLPHLKFIFPHAPYRPVTLNQGYEMRAWYDILGLQPNSPQDAAGIAEMQRSLGQMLSDELATGLPSQRLLLAGFSQGGAMALHTALRYPMPLAGVLALSTYLPLKEQCAAELHQANQSCPIWMAHGVDDSVIPLSTALAARDTLLQAGLPVTWHTYAMAHSVCDDEIDDIRQFLLQVLPAISG